MAERFIIDPFSLMITAHFKKASALGCIFRGCVLDYHHLSDIETVGGGAKRRELLRETCTHLSQQG